MAARSLAEGDVVVLLDRAGNRRLIRLRAGGRLDSHKGYVDHDRLIGADEGTSLRTQTGAVYTALRPRLADYVLEMPRSTAIVYPKDAGTILVHADIYPGATVLEAGLGSGALTLVLLRAVGPSGRVIVYEAREELIAPALANIGGFGEPAEHLTVHRRDVYEGIQDGGLDRLVLDLAEPWQVVPHALTALRLGGIAAFYSPSVVQIQRTVEALERSNGFGLIETLEVIQRPWHVKGNAIRPVLQMTGHTGFLTFARRLLEPPPPITRARAAPPTNDAAEAADKPTISGEVDIPDEHH